MKVKTVMALVIAFIFLSSVSVVSAAPDKTYADSLKELKDKKVIEDVKKTTSEKAKYTHAVSDKVKTDKKSSITVSAEKDKLKFKSNSGKHEVQNLQVAYDLVAPYIVDGAVRVEHKTDSGITDAVWIQKVKNDNGYVYFDNMPFSEIIIGGYTGTYIKTGIMTYDTSNILNLGSTFRANSTNFLNATVTPQYEEDSPYDIPTDGLVAWYKFDEGSGTAVNDSSGNGNHGTASGMTWTDGKYNGAGSFDGTDDIVNCGYISMSNNMTFIMFVNQTLDNDDEFSTSMSKSKSFMFYPFNPTNNVHFHVYQNESTYVRTNGGNFRPLTGVNYCITGTVAYESGTTVIKMYVDGVYLESNSFVGSIYDDLTSPVMIGDKWSGSGYFPGMIDNCILYNRTLSEAEIKQIYYDSLTDLQFKTNSNSEYSTQIDESGTVSIPYDSEDSDIANLTAYVPETVTIGGVTVRDYNRTVTPFTLTATVGYTEDTTLVSESIANNVYNLNISYSPSYSSIGNISYITAELGSYDWLGNIELDSDDTGALISSWNATNFEIQTGSLTAGQTYEYNISVDVYNVPVAEFEVSSTVGYHTVTTAFTDLSTNSPTAWLWDFGDGSTSASQNPTHTYSAGGYYTVTLTATNPAGHNTETKTDVIHVIPPVQDTIDSDFVNSWSNTVSMVGAIIVIALAGSAIAVFRGKRDITDLVNDLPGIVLIVVLLVTGAIIFGQF